VAAFAEWRGETLGAPRHHATGTAMRVAYPTRPTRPTSPACAPGPLVIGGDDDDEAPRGLCRRPCSTRRWEMYRLTDSYQAEYSACLVDCGPRSWDFGWTGPALLVDGCQARLLRA